MSFDRMRLYDAGRFHDTELPDWYHAAVRISETERVDWHRALERVLDCKYTLLTEEDLLFFSVHQKEDVGHVNQGLGLVSEICTSEQMQHEALQAVDLTCRMFYGMYEDMYRHYCKARVVVPA